MFPQYYGLAVAVFVNGHWIAEPRPLGLLWAKVTTDDYCLAFC